MLSDDQMLQLILILDSIAIHFQYYLTDQVMYLILGTSMAAIHIILYFIEQFCQNLYLRTTLNIFKLLLVLLSSYPLNQSWMMYVGIQLTCIVKVNTKIRKIVVFTVFCVHIILISIADSDYLPTGILRNCLCYFLIFLQFKKPTYTITQLSEIISQITTSSDVIIILDNNFMPMNDCNSSFQNILKEQIILYHDDKIDRIVTHRESVQLGVKLKLLDDKGVVQFCDVLQSLKLNNTQWLGQYYDTMSESQIYIKKIDFFYTSHCSKRKIQDKDDIYLVVKKQKLIQTDCASQDQAKQMMKTLSKVSHDMRTPLNAIINMQICLKDQIDPGLTERYLKPSLNSCRLLLNLVNDILDQAQLKSNKIRLVFRKFNLKKLIEKTIAIFDIQKEKKELTIQLNYSEDIPEIINSDKNRVRQVVMNLLSNAVKYSLSKGVIEINLLCNESQQIFTIQVIDNGLGIKQENLKKLFQEFAKVDDRENQQKNPNGIGLGLLISNELSRLLSQNGEGITVVSSYGSGSTFQFTVFNQKNPDEDLSSSQNSEVPVHEVNNFPESRFFSSNLSCKSKEFSVAVNQLSSETNKDKPFIASNQHIKKYNLRVNSSNLVSSNRLLPFSIECEKSFVKKSTNQSNQIIDQVNIWMEQTQRLPPVLIVDDNEFNIVVLQYILEQLYLTCDSAISGLIAIKKCQERARLFSQYKLILLDIEMPEMDGIETAAKLLEFDPQLRIVACTGHRQNQEQIDIYKRAGMQGVIEKPVTKAHLRDLLCKFTDQTVDTQFSHYF